jgi:hypothetical protein
VARAKLQRAQQVTDLYVFFTMAWFVLYVRAKAKR